MSFHWLLALDECENLLTINVVSASIDDGVADFSDEHNQSRWSVVMLRVGPYQSNRMHDWYKQVSSISKLFRGVGELVKQFTQGLKILIVLIGFGTSGLYLLLELAKRSSVGRLVLLEELKNFLDLLRAELFANGVQVVTLVFPEVDFCRWIRVISIFQCDLWVLLENILDLAGPME